MKTASSLLAAALLAAAAAGPAAAQGINLPSRLPANVPATDPGRTTVDIWRDPLDDSVRAFAVFRVEGGRLTIGCNRDDWRGVRIMLADRGWFAPSQWRGRRPVRYRFDDGRARTSIWRTDEGFAYTQSRRNVRSFLQWMVGAQRVSMRATDVENREREFVFQVAGARGPLTQVLQACGPDAAEMLRAINPSAQPQRERRRRFRIPSPF